jgi:hypothetical protein
MALEYEYLCKTNGKTLSVRHGMNEVLRTWKELCDCLGITDDSASADAEIQRVVSGGTLALPRRVSKQAPRFDLDQSLYGDDSCVPCPCSNNTDNPSSCGK